MIPSLKPEQFREWLAVTANKPLYVELMTLDDLLALLHNLFGVLATVIPAGEFAEDLPGGYRFTNSLPANCELVRVESCHTPRGFGSCAKDLPLTLHAVDAYRLKALATELREGLLEDLYQYVSERSGEVALAKFAGIPAYITVEDVS